MVTYPGLTPGAQMTRFIIPTMMCTDHVKARSLTNTLLAPPSIFIVFGPQCCISCLLLAPHTQCTRKQKSILLIGQCHHNYSFETAIENKLHLHCVFIRLLRVSNVHPPTLPYHPATRPSSKDSAPSTNNSTGAVVI